MDVVINAISTKPRPPKINRGLSVNNVTREELNSSRASANSGKFGSENLPIVRRNQSKQAENHFTTTDEFNSDIRLVFNVKKGSNTGRNKVKSEHRTMDTSACKTPERSSFKLPQIEFPDR